MTALSTDQDQPINLSADRADIDNARGISVYTGSVLLTQGTLEITGDIMTVYTAGHEIKKVVVEGTPATYKQRPDDQDEDIRAQAPRMEYHADDEQINLLHGAKLIQGMNEFSGARIDYDIRQDLVRARGEPSGTQRIEIVIHPKKNSSSKKQGAQ